LLVRRKTVYRKREGGRKKHPGAALRKDGAKISPNISKAASPTALIVDKREEGEIL